MLSPKSKPPIAFDSGEVSAEVGTIERSYYIAYSKHSPQRIGKKRLTFMGHLFSKLKSYHRNISYWSSLSVLISRKRPFVKHDQGNSQEVESSERWQSSKSLAEPGKRVTRQRFLLPSIGVAKTQTMRLASVS